MKAFGLALLLFVGAVSAQSSLPACTGSDVSRWTNCQGTATFSWGKYVGEFKDGKFHGQGIGTSDKGNRYVGEHRDGKPHGKGTFTWTSGNQYNGEFRDGKLHGQGTFTWANGNRYVGEHRDGKQNGQGTYTTATGHKYVGEFRDSKLSGQGIVTYADGRPPEEGVFEEGRLVHAQRIPDHIAGRAGSQAEQLSRTSEDLGNKPVVSQQSSLDLARKKCEELGLRSGTEKFGECVLRLSK